MASIEATPLTRTAAALTVLSALACLAGLLAYWATGFLDPEAGSGTGERLFLTLAPAVLVAVGVWLLLRRAPTASAVVRLAVLALGWGLFLATG
ncbi:hypothetical protein [Phycicoccus flavus]|uniref:hypothetical protein n=1 Tax=Phycicoccus flavus TaxID=2502783 RepID=UPI000FEB7B23|nr:hypothetical protein [Phycicoccus flavus]NHA67326.1 hypothetical protein [Phycicoccus flavus]